MTPDLCDNGKTVAFPDVRDAGNERIVPRVISCAPPGPWAWRKTGERNAERTAPLPRYDAAWYHEDGFTFRNLCKDRRLSGRGTSLNVCGQLVQDTSPT